jgi:hypothetical protein
MRSEVGYKTWAAVNNQIYIYKKDHENLLKGYQTEMGTERGRSSSERVASLVTNNFWVL